MGISLFLISLFTFVELNCENLFDCQKDSLTQDEEFLPDGLRHWTAGRYWSKLNHIGQEIISCGETAGSWSLPDMVALCEVENDSVLRDLTKRSLLRPARYEYLVTHSPDVRGLDVALLYSPFTFKPINHRDIPVIPLPGMRPTRNILYASGIVLSGDTLHVFVVHAPSRFGGERTTRSHRMKVARELSLAVDSVRRVSRQPLIVIAGDFNDYSSDKSLRYISRFGLKEISIGAKGSHGAEGTYRYRGEWGSLDHIFCNEPLALKLVECRIFDAPFLLVEDEKYGGVKPFRCYNGPRYSNGFSDHLPLVARFRYE